MTSTIEEYNDFMRRESSIDKRLCQKIDDHLSEFGASQLDKIDELLTLTLGSIVELHQAGVPLGYEEKLNALPYMLAILRDLPLDDLSKIVAHFEIDAIGFIKEISEVSEVIYTLSGKMISAQSFCSRMVEVLMHDESTRAEGLLAGHLDDENVLMAFIARGGCPDTVSTMIDTERQLAKQQDQLALSMPFQGLVSSLSVKWNVLDQLPQSSPEAFFMVSGSLNSHLLRKNLCQCSFWEDRFAQLEYNYAYAQMHNEATVKILTKEFLVGHEASVRMMLSNLDMTFANDPCTLFGTMHEAYAMLRRSPLEDVCEKVTFALSFLRLEIPQSARRVSLGDLLSPAQIMMQSPDANPVLVKILAKVESLGCDFLQTVIDETLETPDDHVGYHLLSIPSVLARLELPAQKLRSNAWENYLNKLVPIAIDFKLGDTAPDYKKVMDDEIDAGMRHWFRVLGLSHQHNFGVLNTTDSLVADQLVGWGLDVQWVPEPSERALAFGFERDIGL